jgi:hypothetical protein
MAKLILEPNLFETYLVEVVTGKRLFYVGESLYGVKFPDMQDRDFGRILYSKIFHEMRVAGMNTKDEMRESMKSNGIFPPSFYRRVETLGKNMDMNRKEKELSSSQIQKMQLDMEFEKMGEELAGLENEENSMLENSAESQAEKKRLDYFLSKCLYTGNDMAQRYWPKTEDFAKTKDAKFVSIARYNFVSIISGMPPTMVRAVARDKEWRKIWEASKKTGSPLFDGCVSSWDKNKLYLCHWSEFYDSIYSYHTPPSEDIIYDDEKLFEWIRETNRMNASGSRAPKDKGSVETKSVAAPYKVRPRRVQ